jgi:hypothetical protein
MLVATPRPRLRWNDQTSSAFGLALVHSLCTGDGAKVLILTTVAALIAPFKRNPKSRTGRMMRDVLKAVSGLLQAIL